MINSMDRKYFVINKVGHSATALLMSEQVIIQKAEKLCTVDGELLSEYEFFEGEKPDDLIDAAIFRLNEQSTFIAFPADDGFELDSFLQVARMHDCTDQARKLMHLDNFISTWVAVIIREALLTWAWVELQFVKKAKL